jgi:hypothetical protein
MRISRYRELIPLSVTGQWMRTSNGVCITEGTWPVFCNWLPLIKFRTLRHVWWRDDDDSVSVIICRLWPHRLWRRVDLYVATNMSEENTAFVFRSKLRSEDVGSMSLLNIVTCLQVRTALQLDTWSLRHVYRHENLKCHIPNCSTL